MPKPVPREGESQSDFVSRCMRNATMREEFSDSDQRLAVCSSIWERRNRRAIAQITLDGATGDIISPVHEDPLGIRFEFATPPRALAELLESVVDVLAVPLAPKLSMNGFTLKQELDTDDALNAYHAANILNILWNERSDLTVESDVFDMSFEKFPTEHNDIA